MIKYIIEIKTPDDAFVLHAMRIFASVREQLPQGWEVSVKLESDKNPTQRIHARKTR